MTNHTEFAAATRRYRAGLVALYLVFILAASPVAVSTGFGQSVDTLSMYAVSHFLDYPEFFHSLLNVLKSAPTVIALAALALASVFVEGRWALLVRLVVMLLGANGAAQLLKARISRPYLGVDYELANSFPSGHVTFAASVTLALIAVAPHYLRRAVSVLGWVFVSFVGVAVMALGWHRLSDVLAAMLLVGIFGMVVLPAEWEPSRKHPPRWLPSFFAAGVFVVSALGLGVTGLAYWSRLASGGIAEIIQLSGQVVPGGLVTTLAVISIAGVAASMTLAVDFLCGQ